MLSFFLQKVAGGASLPVLWRHSFESRLYEPARMQETISAAGYGRAFVKGLQGATLYHPSVMLLHLATAAVASVFVYTSGLAARWRSFLGWQLAAWAYVPLHFVLFPDRTDRHFAPAYMLSFVAVLFVTVREREAAPGLTRANP